MMLQFARPRTALPGAAALALAALGLTVPLAPAGGGGNPGVLPVNSNPYGASYAEWSGRHWQWLFSLPADHHPLADTAPVSAGQSGHVWFLGGTFSTVDVGGVVIGQATRDVTIPSGTALFFPIIDVEGSDLEGNGNTEAELRAYATAFADLIDPTSLAVQVDGRSVQNLASFRVQSPLFTYGPLPDNNLLGLPAGSVGHSISDGYWIMLAPLSVGQHTLHFTGSADLTELGGPVFVQDITYHITVAPGK